MEPPSKRLYVRGINKKTFRAGIYQHFSVCGNVSCVEFDDDNRKGFCWVEYEDCESANKAVVQLHQSHLNGTVLDIRLDTSMTKANYSVQKRIKVADSRNTTSNSSSEPTGLTCYYASDGVVVNNIQYPIPQGQYLIKLLRHCHSSKLTARSRPLLDLLTESRHGNKHSKELTESMAMVDAVYRMGHLTGVHWDKEVNVNVYVVADGKTPYTTAAMALFLPTTWYFASIDPLLDFDPSLLGEDCSKRCHMAPCMSQCYNIVDYCKERNANRQQQARTCGVDDSNCDAGAPDEPAYATKSHNIVVACHSHAPLQEFWDRVPSPKHAVVMPCCGRDWSTLSDTPIDTYEDYEVYSPKRRISLYSASAVSVAHIATYNSAMDSIVSS